MCGISVIIPVYNTEQYLKKCVDSVLGQMFQKFEIILVEDGSADQAGQICDDYEKQDERIRVIHQKNCGLALSRRNGLEAAKGKYVMFLDSDDWIDSEMLWALYETAERTGADVVCSQLRRVAETGDPIGEKPVFSEIICNDRKDMVYHLHVTRYINTSAVTKLIRRPLLETVEFPGNLAIGEEHDMVSQLVWKAAKIVITDGAYYNYLMRGGSISHSGYNPKYANSLEKYMEIERAFEQAFPEYRGQLRSFYAEFEMAVITAMCRNRSYDRAVIRKLREHLRAHKKEICHSTATPFYLKCSAVMIIYFPWVFIVLFRGIHLLTGR